MNNQYPIGKFAFKGEVSVVQRVSWINDIDNLPNELTNSVKGLNNEQLNTPYRAGGWMVRQVVHHLADSHMNSFMRFKLALTEEVPIIKPYFEDRWAELEDSRNLSIEISLNLLEALHKRWGVLLKSMSSKDFQKTFFHPESKQNVQLDYNLGNYAWHGKHHVAHITSLRKQMGW